MGFTSTRRPVITTSLLTRAIRRRRVPVPVGYLNLGGGRCRRRGKPAFAASDSPRPERAARPSPLASPVKTNVGEVIVMLRRRLSICFAATIACAAQTVSAQVGGLPGEISARQAADAQLENKINAEAAARSAADTQLQSNINAEAAARAAADAQLQTQIQELRGSGGGGNGGGGTVNVDCASGGSISQALAAGARRVVVRGTCSESVTISRDDVTLQGDGTVGGRIHGPDPDVNTVLITGNRVIIEALTVSGGRNGITGLGASNLTVRNCTVQSTGRSGIAYANGASGTIDGCTVHSNPRDGIVVDGAYATLINSTVINNTRNGVGVFNAGSARIGVTDRSAPAGNTIQQNGGSGIVVTLGSFVTAAMNQVTRNVIFGI